MRGYPQSEMEAGAGMMSAITTKCRVLFAGVLLMLAAACAPADYAQPIQDMDAALNSSVSTLSALDMTLTEKRNRSLREQALTGDALLEAQGEGCSLTATECRLEMRVRSDSGVRTIPYPARSVVPMTGLAELQAYMGKLAAVVAADTTEKISQSTQAAASDLIGIETVLREAAGPGAAEAPSRIAPYEKPVVALIDWVAGAYVDSVKLRALADATEAADPIVQRLVDFHRTAAPVALEYDLGEAQRAYTDAATAYDQARNAGTMTDVILNDYVEAGKRFNAMLTAKAADPLQAFGKAHHALTEELNRGTDLSLAQAIALIKELKTRADAFKDVVDAFRDADDGGGNA